MNQYQRWLAIGSVVLLSSCGFVGKEKAPPTHYVLQPTELPSPKVNFDGPSILVAKPLAAAGFDSNAQYYSSTPYELQMYRDSRWIESPADLLLPLLVRYLEGSGQFNSVLSESISPITGDLRLDTELLMMRQEFFTQPSQVHVSVRAQLLNMRQQTILGIQEFDVIVPASSDDAIGGVKAANQAVEQILTEMTQAVAKWIKP